MFRSIAAAIVLLLAVIPQHTFSAQRPVPHVLLIVPSNVTLPAAIYQSNIARTAVSDALHGEVVFSLEGLDAMRFPGPSPEAEFVALLVKRYQSHPPDLVIGIGPIEGFFGRHRTELWPNTPLMFAGVSTQATTQPDFPADVPGTTVQFDVVGTIDLALRLQPDVKQLVVVAGSSEYDLAQVKFAAPLLEQFGTRVAIHYLIDRSLDSFSHELAALPRDAIVLQLTIRRDATGKSMPPDVVERLSAASNAPSYAFDPTDIGRGVVGGVTINYDGQKDMIGKIARELLLGGGREEVLRMQPPLKSVCLVDARQLKRWHLMENRLPEECQVLNREVSLWQRYRIQFSALGCVIALQLMLISALLWQRRRRVRVESESRAIRDRLAYSERLTSLGEISASVAHEINQPLAAILSNTEAAESLLKAKEPDLVELKAILHDIRQDEERASEVIRHLRKLLRKEANEMSPLDINDVIRSTVVIVAKYIEQSKVELKLDLLSPIAAIVGDRVQLQQVLINLVRNSLEAMTNALAPRRLLTIASHIQQAGFVEIAVTDGGPCIPPAMLERMFDPFFTSKPDGMGLGLYISQSILGAHGGRIWVESSSAGTVFRMAIPATENPPRPAN